VELDYQFERKALSMNSTQETLSVGFEPAYLKAQLWLAWRH